MPAIPHKELRQITVFSTLRLMTTDIKLGVLLPTGKVQWGEGADPRELIGFATRAERLGYDSLFVNDSLMTPRIEALTMLAALAPMTTRATLGTGALLPFLRRPVQAAQALASIDLLCGGRLAVAVGAGFPGRFGRPFYDLSEVPWPRRFARLDETVALWRLLWSADDPVSFHGDILRFDDVPVSTPPFTKDGPPLWLGGATPAALDRTGRLYDGWLPYPPDPSDYRTGLELVRQAAASASRPADAITPALFVTVLISGGVESGRRALDAYARANYGMPLEELERIQAVVTGPAEHVAAELGRYIGAGARHLIMRIGALDLTAQLGQLERLTEVGALLRRA
jgi:alkanesulfonate monooxygenase SsuD/methylene tetrahydromethanopterin reductase-like flavin-dependent oxidoreductase (luciferase family)